MPSDNVADELNRREAERIGKILRGQPALGHGGGAGAHGGDIRSDADGRPARCCPSLVPRRRHARRSGPGTRLTPRSPTLATPAPAAPQPVAVVPTATPAQRLHRSAAGPGAAADPDAHSDPQPAGPTPPPSPTVTSGAPGRPFGQTQIVPPQQPTLTLEVHKGTAIKLPGPAATVLSPLQTSPTCR